MKERRGERVLFSSSLFHSLFFISSALRILFHFLPSPLCYLLPPLAVCVGAALFLLQVNLMAKNPDDNQGIAAAEVVQIPRELPDTYRWVSPDVLGAPCTVDQDYLDELKDSGVIFGGGELERRYRVEVARRGERVCFMNLNHPRVPHWLWVNEMMFTEFGVRVPFTDFQQRLLNRACIAPSQLHPNA
ncbi:hypothetical protein PIB30_019628 [Stylosanthes scabra]|uniref:Uncharacterized protein n=1 Tax=Stylosanthes scabra TaxID=79078 RepID=A0ABU6R8J8_9FABA|nr:hypothetical protein [Stylosanthes scabra]